MVRDNGSPTPAVARMHAAFWTLLADRPYPSITVRDVARAAQVNKNSFYYHYASLDDLAQDAFESNFPFEVFELILRRLIAGSTAVEGMAGNVAEDVTEDASEGMAAAGMTGGIAVSRDVAVSFETKFSHLMLAVGDHSSPMLQRLLKDSMLTVWCGVLGIDRDDLGEQSLLAVDFLYGGIVGMLSHYAAPAHDGVHPSLLFETPFFRRLSAIVPRLVLDTLLGDGVPVPDALHRAAR